VTRLERSWKFQFHEFHSFTENLTRKILKFDHLHVPSKFALCTVKLELLIQSYIWLPKIQEISSIFWISDSSPLSSLMSSRQNWLGKFEIWRSTCTSQVCTFTLEAYFNFTLDFGKCFIWEPPVTEIFCSGVGVNCRRSSSSSSPFEILRNWSWVDFLWLLPISKNNTAAGGVD